MLENSSSDEYESNNSVEEWSDVFLRRFSLPLLCRVEQPYIDDSFNMYGLSEIIEDFDRSMEALRGGAPGKFSENEKLLFYLIHQRYIITKQGLEKMYGLINQDIYGRCQRVQCRKFPLLPVGLSDFPKIYNTKLFCFCCKEIYEAPGELSRIDGCAFGRTFPHLFSMIYKDSFQVKGSTRKYTPRIFGFQVEHKNK
ncbi:casein kinase II subunit beta [Nematocida sp. LUAm3]|nr:casein kinase II subunit beta [Nematocida sp. LUAm3]KAI5176140.1 casein kinase II subunit beta [Nematocida sp. LUAm2]KAI5179028.1 casein kinase II subunit beta [Nematocida sp. LUAm1]